jgi:hypothetical protein
MEEIMALDAIPLRARKEGGGTPLLRDWYLKSETGPLKDVLLGPAESFRWMGLENALWSSLVRDTLRKGYKFDKQLAMRQHREMIDAGGVILNVFEEETPKERQSRFLALTGGAVLYAALLFIA